MSTSEHLLFCVFSLLYRSLHCVFFWMASSNNAIDPKSKKILQLLHLRQIFNGVFLKVNKAILNMLHRVEPYVTYGYLSLPLSLSFVKESIYKRGYGKLNKQRIPLTDNSIVEHYKPSGLSVSLAGSDGRVLGENMAGKGKGIRTDYLSGKRNRDGGRKTMWLSDILSGFSDEEDSIDDGIDIKHVSDYHPVADKAVAVNNLGKWKTVTQMISLTILLVIRDSSFTEVGFLGTACVAFLYVSVGLAVWSLVVYMKWTM
ncbi:hypothetical protein L2E82_32629 [Cichorium intybus]|uniref:Uncharacterized protein n=1 Tax=Cichorium intybus TaxID=13427 RepID=A0ACB9BI21_CICIN|nr:hypothetical protein L2E82_32629 [Cichorium intybus]